MRRVLERVFVAGCNAARTLDRAIDPENHPDRDELEAAIAAAQRDFGEAKRQAIDEALVDLAAEELELHPAHQEAGVGRCLRHGVFASADGDCPECQAGPA